MAYSCDRPQFSIKMTSGFISEGQWAVHAVVDYRRAGLVGIRKEVELEAQVELMIGIARESDLGRARRARSVVVLVEGDREIAGLLGGGSGKLRPAASGLA